MVLKVTRETKKFINLILTLTALAMLAVFTTGIGEPTGPDTLTVDGSSRFATLGPQNTEAIAGNVTELTVVAQTATKTWQGYYGNVSGTITLENALGDVFYDWSASEPRGEIYASTNSSVTWANVECFNYTATTEKNLTTEETRYGIDSADVDGIDETFNLTTHDTFYIGTKEITTNTCPSTYVYQNSAYQTNNFQNVLLYDTTGDSLIFSSILENRDVNNLTDKIGFDNTPTDFQLLVAEDEHTVGAAGTTTYYFWVEIE